MVSQAFRKMRFKKKIKNRFPLIALHSNCDSPALIGRRPSSGTAAAMRCFGGIAFLLRPPAGVCCKILFVSATSIRCFLILCTDYMTKGLPWSEAGPMWRRMSAAFAKSTSGTVHVFQNARSISVNSVWGTIEYPILKQKGVKIIYHLIP